jgi:DNA-directed RNA polymerase specialized sigma24 family protein
MPFDALTGPDRTARLTWLWNHRASLTASEWQEFYVRVVHDIFAHYRFGELGKLLQYFDHDQLCHECFDEKIWAGDYTDRREHTYPAFYRRVFHNFLVDIFRRNQDEIRNTETFTDDDGSAESEEEGEGGSLPTETAIAPQAPPLQLLDAEFSDLMSASARSFIASLDDVDRLLLKCWFATDGEVPLVRFRPIVGAKYNSRAIRLGIKVQEADETYADYGDTLIGRLWSRICQDWSEIHPGRYVPEDGITELVSIVKREALQLAQPDCRAVLGEKPAADGPELGT